MARSLLLTAFMSERPQYRKSIRTWLRRNSGGSALGSFALVLGATASLLVFAAVGRSFRVSILGNTEASPPDAAAEPDRFAPVEIGEARLAGLFGSLEDVAQLARRFEPNLATLESRVQRAQQEVDALRAEIAQKTETFEATKQATKQATEDLDKRIDELAQSIAETSVSKMYGRVPDKLRRRKPLARPKDQASVNGWEPLDQVTYFARMILDAELSTQNEDLQRIFGEGDRLDFFVGALRDLRREIGEDEWLELKNSRPTVFQWQWGASRGVNGVQAILEALSVDDASRATNIEHHFEMGKFIDKTGKRTAFADRLWAVNEMYEDALSEGTRARLFSDRKLSDRDVRALESELSALTAQRKARLDQLDSSELPLLRDHLEQAEQGLQDAMRKLENSGAVADKLRAFYEATRGYSPQVREELWNKLVAPLVVPEEVAKFDVRPEQGILLYGPPGTGKTFLARSLGEALGGKERVLVVKGSEFEGSLIGESQANLRAIVEEAAEKSKSGPFLLVFDELDAALPVTNGMGNDAYRSAFRGFFLSLVEDVLAEHPNLVMVGTTNRPNKIEPALLREGRFGSRIRIGNPVEEGRLEALSRMFEVIEHEVDIEQIARRTAGYSFADLSGVINEAKQLAFQDALRGVASSLSASHVSEVLSRFVPSSLRQNSIEINGAVRFSDIGGLDDVIATLRENIEFPILHGDRLRALGVEPRVVSTLLYGPPGNGKTFVISALANETKASVVAEAASAIRSAEDVAAIFERARDAAPAIVVIDELEALVPRRGSSSTFDDKIVNEFLTQMSGLSESGLVAVVGMTNRPGMIDPALLRAGRLESQVLVDLPNTEARLAILRAKTSAMALGKGDSAVDLELVAKQTNGYSGADLDRLVYDAAKRAALDERAAVDPRDFVESLKEIKPSVSREELANYNTQAAPREPFGFTNAP